MRRPLFIIVLMALISMILAGCGADEKTSTSQAVVTPPELSLVGTYMLQGFQTDYYDTSYNYVGSIDQTAYASWSAQLQLGSGQIYQAYALESARGELAGTYAVTYTSGTWEGTFLVTADGVGQEWDFLCSGDSMLTSVIGYDPYLDLFYIDYNYWTKTSDTPTAF
ncbi:MAG: hypothetical protein JSV00_07495 [bacterium]|nr:MAG: hypothetical protein JSV00_07495 [bacterium]